MHYEVSVLFQGLRGFLRISLVDRIKALKFKSHMFVVLSCQSAYYQQFVSLGFITILFFHLSAWLN